MNSALPMITGLRLPMRSESHPSSGQPKTQPRGTIEAMTHGVVIGKLKILLKCGYAPNHVADRGRCEQQSGNNSAEIRLGIRENNLVRLQERAEASFLRMGSKLFLGRRQVQAARRPRG